MYGNYSLSMPVLSLLTKHGIICHCLDYYGNYLGAYYPKDNRNISKLVLLQYELVNNKKELEKFQLMSTKEYYRTGVSLLRYYKRKGHNINIPKIILHKNHNIMEAHNKQQYYKSLDELLMEFNYKFEKRTYRPPHNIVNSLMSFLNALLYKDILNIIYRRGLDPKISFTHAINNRRPHALEYDIADFIRPVIVDRLIIKLLKKNKIKTEMFDTSKGYYLKQIYIKEMILYYQKFMEDTYGYTFGNFNGYQLINYYIEQIQLYLKERTKIRGARLK